MNPCTQIWLKEALRLAKPVIFELGFPANSDHYSYLLDKARTPLLNPDIARQFTAENCDPDSFLALLFDLQALYDILIEEYSDMEEMEYMIATNPKVIKVNQLLYWGEWKSEEEEEEEEEYWEEEDFWEDDPEEEEEEDVCSSANNFVTLDDFIETCLGDDEDDDPEDEDDP